MNQRVASNNSSYMKLKRRQWILPLLPLSSVLRLPRQQGDAERKLVSELACENGTR